MSAYSKIILGICFLFISTISVKAIDQKRDLDEYLVGAVLEVDGKVVFSETIQTKHTADQIYQLIDQWTKDKEKDEKIRYHSRIIYNDTVKHELVMAVDHRLIFTDQALNLDYAIIYYYLIFNIENQKCDVTIKNIKYKYAPEMNILTADNTISDDVALNKDKTEILRFYKKFRIGTVDMVDETFDELEQYLNKEEYQAIKEAARSKIKTRVTTSNNVENTNDVVIQPNVKAATPVVENSISTIGTSLPTTKQDVVEETKNVVVAQQNIPVAEAAISPIAEATPVIATATSAVIVPKNKVASDTEAAILKLSREKAFAQSNFFIVGESTPYVRQLSAISISMIDDKASIIGYVANDGTMLSQGQIMPSSKFKILYYTPNSGSYTKLAELSKKYAQGKAYTDDDITFIEVLLENSKDPLRCSHLKIETQPTSSVSNNPTIVNMPSVGKFINTNKCVIMTGNIID